MAAVRAMNFLRYFNRKSRSRAPGLAELIDGGCGDSFETAAVIHTHDLFSGIQTEYCFIASQCGDRDKAWTVQSQRHGVRGCRSFDVLTIVLTNGDIRTFYFDITEFHGR